MLTGERFIACTGIEGNIHAAHQTVAAMGEPALGWGGGWCIVVVESNEIGEQLTGVVVERGDEHEGTDIVEWTVGVKIIEDFLHLAWGEEGNLLEALACGVVDGDGMEMEGGEFVDERRRGGVIVFVTGEKLLMQKVIP